MTIHAHSFRRAAGHLLGFFSAGLLLAASACGDSATIIDDPGCTPGEENCTCDDQGACDSGLTCEEDICVPSPSVCRTDERVSDGACVACASGTSNEAGDDPSGEDTSCDPIFCEADELVSNNTCAPCAPGTTNDAGDDASGPDTTCEPILCGANEYVQSNACTPCPSDTTNEPGDDASGQDTLCEDACSMVFGKFCFELEPTYLKASNPDSGDEFGHRVAVSGDIIAVTARYERSNATGIDGDQMNNSVLDGGAIYVFERDAQGTWQQTAYLKPPNISLRDNFGQALAIDGNTIVAGALFEDSDATSVNGDPNNEGSRNSGAAYVFVRDAQGTWSQQAYLKAPNAQERDVFGISVAIDGDTIAVGATQEDSNATGVDGDQANNAAENAGAVYVFARTQGIWTQTAYLKASNTGAGDDFGSFIAVDGDTIAVGAGREDSNAMGVDGNQMDNSASSSGAVYVFTKDMTGLWTQQAYIKASNTGAGDGFGARVALDGDTLAVAARRESSDATGIDGDGANDLAENAGAVYVFVRDAQGTWTQQAYIKSSNSGANDEFGRHLALSNQHLVVGATLEDGSSTGFFASPDDAAPDAGAVYVFVRDMTGAWSEVAYLKAPNAEAGDMFGVVDFDGSRLVCGAVREQSGATGVDGDQLDNSLSDAGAVFVYDIVP